MRFAADHPHTQFLGLSQDSLVVPVGPGESRVALNGLRVARGGLGVYPLLGRLDKVATRG